MHNAGLVASGHDYPLPEGWQPVSEEVHAGALARTIEALDASPGRLERYFDPARPHAATSFNTLDRGAGGSYRIHSSDLLAVSLLEVRITPRQVRQLLDDHPKRAAVTAALAEVPRDATLAEFNSGARDTAVVLTRLQRLYDELRTTPDADSDSWEFASKLCARKIPHLMPVRGPVVCEYLTGASRGTTGGIGQFEDDIQVFAFVMSSPDVRARLKGLEARLRSQYGVVAEAVPPLRILDVALWMAGRDAGLVQAS